MKIAIVGSRNFRNQELVKYVVNGLREGTILISGGARGVDHEAAVAGRVRGLEVIEFEADWKKLGKAAGPIRNTDIVNECDFLIAFWDGKSRGTKDSMEKAERAGKLYEVYTLY